MNPPPRSAGLLLHVSSLPGPHGSGDLGPDAHRFVDWLASAGQTLWQTLPLNPAGPGDSPYQSPSAFAGNPLLVALAPLVERGWLAAPVPPATDRDAQRVDFGRVAPWRLAQLRTAAAGFFARAGAAERAAWAAWCAREAGWLDDYALFMALHRAAGHQPWWTWPAPLRDREPAALQAARAAQAAEIDFQRFVQWCFETQLAALKAHANARGVALVGDLPIFVAHDSADCWSRPDLYALDADGQPTVVAGAPPDLYTADGQRWGNPLYRWDRMAAEGHAWWTARVRRLLTQADVFRIDHFRGFAACWEIPADQPTARGGRWVPGPGAALFEALERALGPLPIVAEDLGHITPDVVALRERFGWPGMRIVYEGLIYGAQHPFLPHHHVPGCLAYTSTHDSDTVAGWWQGASAEQRDFATAYLGLAPQAGGADAAQAVLRATWVSVAGMALAPMQDLLGLDSAHRMNRPGSLGGNWAWRFDWADLPPDAAARLRALTEASDRARR
ncbi:MAG: 4-alpha-glucanotransferase [Burkholderiales bacterium]|nr:4-alpha-glucanotransferase [Burkholderiales bacterium]